MIRFYARQTCRMCWDDGYDPMDPAIIEGTAQMDNDESQPCHIEHIYWYLIFPAS